MKVIFKPVQQTLKSNFNIYLLIVHTLLDVLDKCIFFFKCFSLKWSYIPTLFMGSSSSLDLPYLNLLQWFLFYLIHYFMFFS